MHEKVVSGLVGLLFSFEVEEVFVARRDRETKRCKVSTSKGWF